MSVAGILDVVVDRRSVVGTVSVGVKVVLLEIELAGLVQRENVAGERLCSAVAACVVGACFIQTILKKNMKIYWAKLDICL